MRNLNALLVDDDPMLRVGLCALLEHNGFHVTVAAGVTEGLKLIQGERFVLLVSDLHRPTVGDGLSLANAMRHAHPGATVILLNVHPEMEAATHAIVLQTDAIMVKPIAIDALLKQIRISLELAHSSTRKIETVATVLQRSIESTIEIWFGLVKTNQQLMDLPLTRRERTAHLPRVFDDLVRRLRTYTALGSTAMISMAAVEHGIVRRSQGYLASMMVEESRMLQVSIFETLQRNLPCLDVSVLLIQVMTIADEVDFQLAQAMESYNHDVALPALA
jgi:DNA-binding response OmpR family regulator